MQTLEGTGAVRSVHEVTEALSARVAMLTRLFLRRTGVSRVEAGVLGAVAGGPQRVTALAEREGCTQPAISRLVDRLEARGWVVRESDPLDGRVCLVALTPDGREMADRLRTAYREMLQDEMVKLADEDVRVLARAVDVLDDLVASLREHHP